MVKSTGVGRAVVALLGALLVALALVALVAPRPPFTVYRQPVVVAGTVVLLLAALLWRPPARLRRWCAWRWTGLLVASFAGVVAMVTGQSLRLRYSWDVRIVLEVAGRLNAGDELTSRQLTYVSRYPNNTLIIGIDRVAARVADAAGWQVDVLLVAVTAIGAGVAVWAVHRMVLPVGGPVRAVGAQLVTTLLVAASPWVAIPYTDMLALPFLSVGLLLAMTAMRRRHDRWALLLAAAAGASVGVAALLKTIPYVVVGAVVLTGVLAAVAVRADRGAALRWMGGTTVAVVAFAVTALGTTAVAGSTVLADTPTRSNASAPLLWWLANGTTKTQSPGNPPRYGGFNAALGRAISGKTRPEASDWSAQYLRSQWNKRGPMGTARFYANKAAWNWGDGMFWAWGEGQDSMPNRVLPGGGAAAVVRAVNRPEGRGYATHSDLAQAVWLTVIATGGLGALLTRRPRAEVLLLALSVLGLMVFTLLFQGRSRYLFTFVPVVVALAAMVHPDVGAVRARLVRARRAGVSRSSRSAPAPE